MMPQVAHYLDRVRGIFILGAVADLRLDLGERACQAPGGAAVAGEWT